MMKILSLLLLFLSTISFSLEQPFYLYRNQFSIINPATTGVFNRHFASVNIRNHSPVLSGSFVSVTGLYDTRLKSNKSSLGLSYQLNTTPMNVVLTDKISLKYARHFYVSRKAVLSAGLSLSGSRFKIDYDKLTWPSPNPYITTNLSNKPDYFVNISGGITLKTRKLLCGLSVIDAFEQKGDHFQTSRQFYANLSYDFKFFRKWIFTPALLLNREQDFMFANYNLTVAYKQLFWLGASYQTSNNVAGMVGADIAGKYRVGYSYSHSTSTLTNSSAGSHEFILALMLN